MPIIRSIILPNVAAKAAERRLVTSKMITFTYTVGDKNGIHARPAGTIVNTAKKYACEITIKKDGTAAEKAVDAKRLFSVMSLGAVFGDRLVFALSGQDEVAAAKELEEVCRKTLG